MTRITFVANSGVMFHESGLVSQSSRIRVLNLSQKLKERGFSSDVHFLLNSSVSEIHDAIRKSDLVLFHRIQAEKRFIPHRWTRLYFLAKRERPVIFDFDDSIQLDFPILTELCIKASDAVTVGSHELSQYSRRLNQNTYLIPSAVDVDVYRPPNPAEHAHFEKRNNTVVIGWHGSAAAHWRNLLILKDVLRKLKQKLRVDIVLRLIGGPFTPSLASQFNRILPVQSGPEKWVEYDELPQYISGVDIGVYPLADTSRMASKASMKMLEQMAMGIPVVASSVGENRHITTNGYDGFLVSNVEEWISRLQALIENPELRNTVGAHARETVLRNYSLDVAATKLAGVFDSLIE